MQAIITVIVAALCVFTGTWLTKLLNQRRAYLAWQLSAGKREDDAWRSRRQPIMPANRPGPGQAQASEAACASPSSAQRCAADLALAQKSLNKAASVLHDSEKHDVGAGPWDSSIQHNGTH